MTGPSRADRAKAAPYLLTALLSRVLLFAAVAGGLWAAIALGPLAGIAAFCLGLWVARLARAPMPPDLRDKFN